MKETQTHTHTETDTHTHTHTHTCTLTRAHRHTHTHTVPPFSFLFENTILDAATVTSDNAHVADLERNLARMFIHIGLDTDISLVFFHITVDHQERISYAVSFSQCIHISRPWTCFLSLYSWRSCSGRWLIGCPCSWWSPQKRWSTRISATGRARSSLCW